MAKNHSFLFASKQCNTITLILISINMYMLKKMSANKLSFISS